MQPASNRHGEKLAVDVLEAARLLSLGKHSIRSFVRRGLIPAIKLGCRVLVPVRPLTSLVEARERLPTTRRWKQRTRALLAEVAKQAEGRVR